MRGWKRIVFAVLACCSATVLCDSIRIVRAAPSYLVCRRLSQLAVEAFYGRYTWSQGPAIALQRGIIEADVLTDVGARLRYYEEARMLGLTHIGAVFMAEDESTGALWGFADIGLAIYDGNTFSLPKRPEGDVRALESSTHELRPYLSNLAVDESARGNGIGRRLVRACEEEARSWTDGAHGSVWLEVTLSNENAHGFYRQLGYEQAAVTLGREIVRQRWSLEAQQVSRRLMRKTLPQPTSGVVVPTTLAADAPPRVVPPEWERWQ